MHNLNEISLKAKLGKKLTIQLINRTIYVSNLFFFNLTQHCLLFILTTT